MMSPESGPATAVAGLVVAVFTALWIYALVETGGETVAVECPTLWDFMLARLLATAVLCLGLWAPLLWFGPSAGDRQMRAAEWAGLVAYFTAFSVAGGVTGGRCMGGACLAVLSAGSFTATPLLMILCWVSTGVDSLTALILLMYGLFTLLGYAA